MAHKGGWDYETPHEILCGWFDAFIANSPLVGICVAMWLFAGMLWGRSFGWW